MRQILSTAITAMIVAALTAVSISALAQDAPTTERTVAPAAVSNINAHRVDGKHAVGFTNKLKVRRNKLVATNKQGLLPSNIVRPLWRLIKGKPAVLADGAVGWNEVAGTPAGFADGVDDVGVTGLTVTMKTASSTLTANTNGGVEADCPAGTTLIGGGHWTSSSFTYNYDSYPNYLRTGWYAGYRNTSGSSASIGAYAFCLSTQGSGAVTPAGRVHGASVSK